MRNIHAQRVSCSKLLNRSVPLFPKNKIILKSKEQKLIKIDTPFTEEFSGLVIDKILVSKAQSILTITVKFARNAVALDVTNSCMNMLRGSQINI